MSCVFYNWDMTTPKIVNFVSRIAPSPDFLDPPLEDFLIYIMLEKYHLDRTSIKLFLIFKN